MRTENRYRFGYKHIIVVQTSIVPEASVKQQVMHRTGKPRYIKPQPPPSSSHIFYTHNEKSTRCLPKTVHLEADMLNQQIIHLAVA